jgi:hypothetical protein
MDLFFPCDQASGYDRDRGFCPDSFHDLRENQTRKDFHGVRLRLLDNAEPPGKRPLIQDEYPLNRDQSFFPCTLYEIAARRNDPIYSALTS